MFTDYLYYCYHYWINLIISQWGPKSLLIKLDQLESSGIFWLACYRGYPESGTIKSNLLLINYVFNLWSFLIIARFIVCTTINDDDQLRILLGDQLISIPNESAFNCLCALATIMFVSVHLSLDYLERTNNLTAIKIFDDIRLAKFKLFPLMGKFNCYKFRKYFFLMTQSYFYLSLITCIGSASYLIVNIFDDTNQKISSKTHNLLIVCQIVWLPFLICPLFYLIHNVFWALTHVILLIVYTTFCLDYIHTKVSAIDKLSSSDCSPISLVNQYVYNQNYYYNQIAIMERQLSLITLTGYMVGSIMADFAFFCGVFIETESLFFNIITIGLSMTALGALIFLNLIAGQTVKKVKLCRSLNYQLFRHGHCDKISTKLKLLSTLERLSVHQIGFYVGRLFVMDNHRFLLFLLENISILLLIITNLTKILKDN